MFLMVGGEEGGVHDIVPRHPCSFLWTIALPVYEVFQATPTTSGVQDLPDGIDRTLFKQERQRGHVDGRL